MQCRYRRLLVVLVTLALSMSAWTEPTVRCIHREMPSYPALLRTLKIGGHVKLRLTVSPAGKVTNTKVEGGNPMLAELSCIAAKKWTYAATASTSDVAVELAFDPATPQPSVVE